MEHNESRRLTLEAKSIQLETKIGNFTVRGWKCRRSDGAAGWLLWSQTNENDRCDYWITRDAFYLIPKSSVAIDLFRGGFAVFEASEKASEPEQVRKEALITAISKWEVLSDEATSRERVS
jgi:hypothetical protein